jgi:hypothetical protein
MHDFDIEMPEGLEALDVTRATRPELRELYDALAKGSGLDLGPALGARSWQLRVGPLARVRNLRRDARDVAEALATLESDGIFHFRPDYDQHRSPGVRAFAERFPGIEDCFSFNPSKRGPMVVVVTPGAGSNIGPELVNEFVQAFTAAPGCEDNRRKLDKAGTSQRHLFIWIESTEFGPYESLCDGELPDGVPQLPREITSLWIAATCWRDGHVEAWFVRPPNPWQRVQA